MEIAIKVLPALLEGTKTTLLLFGLTLILSLPLGLFVGVVSTTKIQPIKALIHLYIWVIRGTPLLLQIFFIFYGLPVLSEQFVIDRMPSVVIAFVINYTAYFAEIFRGGIQSISKGQYEGAKVLGLSKWQTARKIVIPQVVKTVMPSIGNEIITLVKDTSLVYVVGLSDLMKAGRIALQRELNIIPLVVVAVIYLALTGIVTIVLKVIEKRFNYYK